MLIKYSLIIHEENTKETTGVADGLLCDKASP